MVKLFTFTVLLCGLLASLPAHANIKQERLQLREFAAELAAIEASATSLADELQQLEAAERELRAEQVNDLASYNIALRDTLRLQQTSQAPWLAPQLLSQQSHRENIIQHVEAALAADFSGNTATLTELHQLQRERQQKLTEIVTLRQEIRTQQQRLAKRHERNLRQNELAISDKTRTRWQRDAKRWQSKDSLDEFFSELPSLQKELTGLTTADQRELPGQLVQLNETAESHLTTGVNLLTLPYSSVPSIQAGKVVYAGPFRQHDQLVIIAHADNLHSVYGGLAATPLVATGDNLNAGDPVGFMPATAQPKLYFEMRQNGEPIDPRPYLSQS